MELPELYEPESLSAMLNHPYGQERAVSLASQLCLQEMVSSSSVYK